MQTFCKMDQALALPLSYFVIDISFKYVCVHVYIPLFNLYLD